jgi:hypothetical protein
MDGEDHKEFNKETEKKEQIKLVLEGGQDFRTAVLAKPSTKVYKLLEAFCKEHKVDQKEYRLIFKDKVLALDERLESYNLPNEATISVVASQVGGGIKIILKN